MEGKSQAATASTTQQEVDDYVAKEAAGWQDSPFMNMSVGGTAINRMPEAKRSRTCLYTLRCVCVCIFSFFSFEILHDDIP